MKSKFSGAVLFVQLRWLLGLYLLEFRSYLNLKKETVLEKLTFGVTTGLIATSIWTFFTTDKNYSSLSAFLNSEVTFSVWVLILISIVCVLLIYINFVNKKRFELDYQLKVRSIATPIQNDGEISEETANNQNNRYKIAKRIITLLKENWPQKSAGLSKSVLASGHYSAEEVEDIIDELVQIHVLTDSLSGGFKLSANYDKRFKGHF